MIGHSIGISEKANNMAERASEPSRPHTDSTDGGSPVAKRRPVQRSIRPVAPADRYHESLTASIDAMARLLQHILSARLTAYTVGIKDVKTVSRWANQEVEAVRNNAVERRLRATFQIALMLLDVESPSTVKAWFIGMNPYLDDVSPAEAIRGGKEREVLDAARAFVASA